MSCEPREPGWYRDPDHLKAEYATHGTFENIAVAHGGSSTTYSKWWQRHQLGKHAPGPKKQESGEQALDLTVGRLDDIHAELRSRGLDPAEWVVIRVVVNTWESVADGSPLPLKQLKVTLRPKLTAGLLMPAEIKPFKTPPARKPPKRDTKLYFIYGDDQRPNVDLGFESAKLQWLQAHRPDVVVDLGDGMDFATLSGHKPNPATQFNVQACAGSYASWLYAVRCVTPASEIVVLADNHVTHRWRDYQLDRAAALYGVTPAEIAGLEDDLEPLLSIRRLLRLDEIGVTYLAPPGDTHYAESQYEIVPGELVALHGYRTGANVGKKFIDDYGCSVVYGHVHDQNVYVTDTNRRGVGTRKRRYALGVGCGAKVHGGIGFAPGADWQNCALTVSVFPDGGWTWDYMNYEHGLMTWRDERYEAVTE